MSIILDVFAREILDSRGNPTVQAECIIECGEIGIASVPSGASTGTHEAVELRDNDKLRYNGKGVLDAIKNINDEIAPNIIGLDVRDQIEIDNILIKLDGTENKQNLGANSILAVSLAVMKAASLYTGLPQYRYMGGTSASVMPVPMCNVLNGGKHAEAGVDFQEFMIVPIGADSFYEAVRMVSETYHKLLEILKDAGKESGLGDEGGFAPALDRNEDAIQFIVKAIEGAGYKAGKDISIAIIF